MTNTSKLAVGVLIFASAAVAGCQESYHEKDERYVLIAANINLPYWQEADAGLRDVRGFRKGHLCGHGIR